MRVQITFKHLDQSQALEKYTEERLNEVARFLLKEASAHVYFSKFRGQFIAEISMNTSTKYLRGTGQNQDIYQGFEEALEKIEKQMIRMRKLHQHHKKPELSREGRLKNVNVRLEHLVPLKKAA
mgnify:CR=1 FL=1